MYRPDALCVSQALKGMKELISEIIFTKCRNETDCQCTVMLHSGSKTVSCRLSEIL